MKRIIVLLFVMSANICLLNGQINSRVGARQASMGGSSIFGEDVNSIWNNQAGLGYIKDISFGVNYENRFLLSELASKSFGVVYPTDYGSIGVSINSYGFTNYNENRIGLSYGRLFNNGLSFGFAIDYMRFHIAEDYGNKSFATIETGMMYCLNDQMRFALHLFNPVYVSLTEDSNEHLPTIFSVGLAYEPNDKTIIIIELEKDIAFSPRLHFGVEYIIIDGFLIRTGVVNNPIENSFGLGYIFKNISIDISFVANYILGACCVISIGYRIK